MYIITKFLKLSLLLFLMSICFSSLASDEIVKLYISCNSDKLSKTSKNLGKIEKFFLIIDQEEVEFFFDKKDTSFVFGHFSESQLQYLERVHLVPMRIILNGKCYITNFPTFELYFNTNSKHYKDDLKIPHSLSLCFLNSNSQFHLFQKHTYLISFPVYEKKDLNVKEYYSNGKRNFVEREYTFLQEIVRCDK